MHVIFIFQFPKSALVGFLLAALIKIRAEFALDAWKVGNFIYDFMITHLARAFLTPEKTKTKIKKVGGIVVILWGRTKQNKVQAAVLCFCCRACKKTAVLS